jgi:hypothetical protein
MPQNHQAHKKIAEIREVLKGGETQTNYKKIDLNLKIQ